MRRSNRYTWMLNGWTHSTWLEALGGGSEVVTIGVPDDFVAVRVGFANITPEAWKVSRVIACASASWNDFYVPVDERNLPRPADAWSVLTFRHGGEDIASLVTVQDAPAEITVAGNTPDPASGETLNARWTFTDWVPCQSAGADPATGMRVLMLRALVPSHQAVTFTNGRMTEFGSAAGIANGYGYFTGGLKRDTDIVTDPARELPGMRTETVEANHLVNGQLICLVQVLTRNAGIIGLVAGDSHQSGISTVSGVSNFVVRSLFAFGGRNIGTLPAGVVNVATGGTRSQHFFPRMTALTDAVRPSFAVLPAWSANEYDASGPASAASENVLFARMLLAADQVRQSGAVPILLTPFPRDAAAMTPAVLRTWLERRDTLLAMRTGGALVFDATPLLGAIENGQFTGTYLEGLSSDAIHPNDAGHAVLADAFSEFLARVPGFPRGRSGVS